MQARHGRVYEHKQESNRSHIFIDKTSEKLYTYFHRRRCGAHSLSNFVFFAVFISHQSHRECSARLHGAGPGRGSESWLIWGRENFLVFFSFPSLSHLIARRMHCASLLMIFKIEEDFNARTQLLSLSLFCALSWNSKYRLSTTDSGWKMAKKRNEKLKIIQTIWNVSFFFGFLALLFSLRFPPYTLGWSFSDTLSRAIFIVHILLSS